MEDKLAIHFFFLETVFVGFRNQWSPLQVGDITLWQVLCWTSSFDKYFSGILKKGQRKEAKSGDIHPCFARAD